MNFLEKILGTSKSDKLGLDSAIDGIKSLKQRLEAERQKLEGAKAKLRDAALVDPDGEIDESPISRQRERIAIFESALEEATRKAAASIDSRTADIDTEIGVLEARRDDLLHQRDQQHLEAIKDFCAATGSRLVDPPTQGSGGAINVVSVSSMTNAEVAEFFKDTPAPKQSKIGLELAAVVGELQKLTLIKRTGSRAGLDALVGTQG